MWFKTVQPVKETHEHFQSVPLGGLHCFAQIRPFVVHIWAIFELGVLLLQRDGIVEEELRSAFEIIWEIIPGEAPMLAAQDIGEHEGGVAGQGSGEDSGQGRECIVGADSEARDGAISEDKNSSDGVNVVFDLSGNTPLVEPVMLNTPGVGQARCIKDANLGTVSHNSACSKAPGPTVMPLSLVNS